MVAWVVGVDYVWTGEPSLDLCMQISGHVASWRRVENQLWSIRGSTMEIYEYWHQRTQNLAVVSLLINCCPLGWIETMMPGLHVLLTGHCLGW